MTRSLVVGGGFLGAHVASLLAQRGGQVTVYSRSFNEWLLEEDRAAPGTIELLEGAVPPGAGLREAIEGSDVVYYLAGSTTPAMALEDPGGSILSSVVPAAAVLDILRTTSTARVVVASSGGTVYGRPERCPTDEGDPTRPISLHGHNALSIERYARFYEEQHGIVPIILRYANPYGPGQLVRRGQGVVAAWCEAVLHDQPVLVYGSLEASRDFIYVEDAAEATVAAAMAGTAGTYNVGSGRSVRLADVLALIEEAVGKKAEVAQIPARGVDVPATQLDCSRLRASTGWVPHTELAAGIEQTVLWIAQRPHL